MSTRPKIVLTQTIHPEILETILRPKARMVLAKNRTHLRKELRNADALICLLSDTIDASLLAGAPSLKVVSNLAVGTDNIDLDYCHDHGILVTNTPDVLTQSTAELSLALLFAAARRVPEGDALCRSGNFRGWDPNLLLGLELRGRRALVVGAGRIGKAVARLYRAIGLKVDTVTSRTSLQSIKKKLPKAQIVSLHLPLHPDTHYWLSKSRLAMLPSDCIVINMARGPVIDESALIVALKQKKIYSAGLDVYEFEPKIPGALRRLPNVVLLPHLGSATESARKAMSLLTARGALDGLAGKRPKNLVELKR